MFVRRKIRPLKGIMQMVASFVKGPAGDVEKAAEFARPIPSEPFGNVAWR